MYLGELPINAQSVNVPQIALQVRILIQNLIGFLIGLFEDSFDLFFLICRNFILFCEIENYDVRTDMRHGVSPVCSTSIPALNKASLKSLI